MKCFTSECDWLHCFSLHKHNLTWLRRRPTFRLLYTEWVTALHKSSGIYLAYSPSLPQTPLWFPRSQHVSWSTLWHWQHQHFILHSQLSRGGQSCFCLTNKSVVCVHTGLLTRACLRSHSFNEAHRLSTIKRQTRCAKACLQHILSNHHRQNLLNGYTTHTDSDIGKCSSIHQYIEGDIDRKSQSNPKPSKEIWISSAHMASLSCSNKATRVLYFTSCMSR